MSVPSSYEAAYNGRGPVAWLVCLPVLAIVGGAFFRIPVVLLAGGAGLLLQALYLIVFDRGLAAAADITARQAGAGLLGFALAAIGYGLNLATRDEGWMWLVTSLLIPIAGVMALTYQGRASGPFRRRWLNLAGYVWLIAIVLFAAAGGAT